MPLCVSHLVNPPAMSVETQNELNSDNLQSPINLASTVCSQEM